MHIILVRNRESGTEGDAGGQVTAQIAAAGHEVTSVSTRENWRDAIKDDPDLVVAMGGDGTVRRVAAALVGRRVPFAIIPAGTANNVATSLELTGLDVSELIARWATAPRVPFDVMVAGGHFDDLVAIEGIGLGVFATTMAALDARDNVALAHAEDAEARMRAAVEHLRQRLADAPALDITASLDGRDISGAYVMFEVCNVPMIGPNLTLAPDASPADGVFDVVMVTERDRARLDTLLARRATSSRRIPGLPTMSGSRLTLEWSGQDLHIDDKAWPGTDNSFPLEPGTIDIRIDPGAVQYLDVARG